MNWTDQVDGYCERVDLTLWSEPINAVTNLAFLIAAVVMWRRTAGVIPARVLCVILFAIGIGSGLFHTHATVWAALTDVAPIGLFILTYLFLVHRDVLGLPLWIALIATALFVPYAAIVVPILDQIPFVQISNFYWTVPILLVAYGVGLRRTQPETARGFMIGAAILVTSIIMRSLDEIVCPSLSIGTHFLWHILNAIMLGYMIHVYTAHVLAGRWARR
ncbi:ceramidase domain-containing protein [Yoonia sp. R2331]|uniref:ceramidase domain-containing protein n=1 Tax=Yoonia sp. R2331 TaxID=3237238 RepID=UPI0034E48AFB